jgi:hypothetical protein
VTFTLENLAPFPQTVDLAVDSDAAFFWEDETSIDALPVLTGVTTSDVARSLKLIPIVENRLDVNSTSTLWIGLEDHREANRFSSGSLDSLSEVDGAFAFSWLDITIPAFGSSNLTFIIQFWI